jgi:16S rRNA (cytosine1402-N4)-methyltransferase
MPVLLKETIDYLNLNKGQTVIDCTLGSGGHSKEILKKIGKQGKLVAIDYDKQNLDLFKDFLATKKIKNTELVFDNFKNIKKIIEKLGIKKTDAILADLGFASPQLDYISGLSFSKKGNLEKLDMRINNKENLKPAFEILNEASKEEIATILKDYGEEPKNLIIADKIVSTRKLKRITTSKELISIIEEVYQGKIYKHKINIATKVFMALRIAVNQEFENLKLLLTNSLHCLKKGGRIAIITFHSLEDRIVKKHFKFYSKKCICDEDQIICNCKQKPKLKLIIKKPIIPKIEEIKVNPRSRSAKLRVAEKI